jgi:hypothetical protein
MAVEIKQDHLKSILKAIHKLASQNVLVGVPAASVDRKDVTEDNNATIAYKMEFGSPQERIPARPSIIPGVKAVQPEIISRFEKAAIAALAGDEKAVHRQMASAGMIARDSIKKLINSNIQPALSARTLAERRARGVSRTNTLVDTAQFRNSITYVFRKV